LLGLHGAAVFKGMMFWAAAFGQMLQ